MKNEVIVQKDDIYFLFRCTDNGKTFYLGINLNDGKPFITSLTERLEDYSYKVQIITYSQLLNYLQPMYFPILDQWRYREFDIDNIKSFEEYQKEYSNLNDENWEEYTVYREGDRVILDVDTRSKRDGVELIVVEDGYILHHECIDNAGCIDESFKIPFGTFKDLSCEEFEKYMLEAGRKVQWSNLCVLSHAAKLIRTDKVICRLRDGR